MRWLIYSAMADLFPGSEQFPGIAACDLPAFWREFSREAPWAMHFAVCVAVCVYVCSPLFTVGIPLPSFLLSRKLRDLHAQRITGSGVYHVRQLMTLLKMVAGFCWGQNAKVRGAVNLPVYSPDPGTFRRS